VVRRDRTRHDHSRARWPDHHITSVHEHIPIEGGTAYCAAKAALGAATKTMALETGAARNHGQLGRTR